MDFSRILDEWERGNRSSRGPGPDPDKDAEPADRTTRAEMERARADDVLDLHGLKRDEAVAALLSFLTESAAAGARKVLVIHGKGLHSENSRGVLAGAVRQALSKNRNVSAWGEAGKKEGGRGASWAWLSARGK